MRVGNISRKVLSGAVNFAARSHGNRTARRSRGEGTPMEGRLRRHAKGCYLVEKSTTYTGSPYPFGSIHLSGVGGVAVSPSTSEMTAEEANSQRLQSS